MSDRSTQVNFLYEKRKRLQKTNTVPRIAVNGQAQIFKTTKVSSLRESGAPPVYEEGFRTYSSAKELRVSDLFVDGKTTPTPYSSGSSTFNEGFSKYRSYKGVPALPPISPVYKMIPTSNLESQSYHNHSSTKVNNIAAALGGGASNGGKCRCFCDPDPNDKLQIPTVTPEGLSWRRLHMSRAKLKATSTTSELLSGFAMIAMVELQINEDTTVPEWLFVMFSVCTTVLVAVHIFALMISTYILPNIDAISKLEICELVAESPHERMKGFIELAWAFSTVLGLFLFLVEVAILCWVKFWDYSFTAAMAATAIILPVLVIFVVFAVHFYHSLIVYKCKTFVGDMQKLEDMKKRLDEVEI